MINRIHLAAAIVAMGCIATFWTASAVGHILLSYEAVADVKQFIVRGLFVLVPALAATGISGYVLAAGRQAPVIKRKLARMKFIAGNGLLVLVPAALYLDFKAGTGSFDSVFHFVQRVELVAGVVNIVLMAQNARDGLRLTARVRVSKPRP